MRHPLLALLASAAIAALSSAASAAPIADTYHGGQSDYSGGVVDIVGDSRFQVNSIDLIRNGNNLQAIISTNYADTITTGDPLGTGMGALFFGNATLLNFNNDGSGNPIVGPAYNYDTWRADQGRFTHAFVPGNMLADSAGTMRSIANGSDVQQSFFPTTGTITGSNFREGQAVGVKASAGTVAGVTGNVDVNTGANTITFNITDFFTIAALDVAALTVAWTMTCANDVILVEWQVPPGADEPVPLPGALALFAGGLGLLGVLGNRRRRKLKAA